MEMQQELECFVRNEHWIYVVVNAFISERNKETYKEKNIETASKYLTHVIKLLTILWKL